MAFTHPLLEPGPAGHIITLHTREYVSITLAVRVHRLPLCVVRIKIAVLAIVFPGSRFIYISATIHDIHFKFGVKDSFESHRYK